MKFYFVFHSTATVWLVYVSMSGHIIIQAIKSTPGALFRTLKFVSKYLSHSLLATHTHTQTTYYLVISLSLIYVIVKCLFFKDTIIPLTKLLYDLWRFNFILEVVSSLCADDYVGTSQRQTQLKQGKGETKILQLISNFVGCKAISKF